MKKILGVLLGVSIIILFANNTHAACSPDDSDYYDCLQKTSASSNTNSTSDAMLSTCKSNGGISSDCTKRYSCETLFVGEQSKADTCNFERCQQVRGTGASYCTCIYQSKGIPLNTNIPFIGNCIQSKNTDGSSAAIDAFPTIIGAVSRIIVTLILLSGTIMVIIGGIQWARGEASEGKKMITKVAVGFALLGAMGAILRFINPNFFK